MSSRYLNVTERQTRTCRSNTMLCIASHGKKTVQMTECLTVYCLQLAFVQLLESYAVIAARSFAAAAL